VSEHLHDLELDESQTLDLAQDAYSALSEILFSPRSQAQSRGSATADEGIKLSLLNLIFKCALITKDQEKTSAYLALI
jgi:hypothetical protein